MSRQFRPYDSENGVGGRVRLYADDGSYLEFIAQQGACGVEIRAVGVGCYPVIVPAGASHAIRVWLKQDRLPVPAEQH